MESSHSNYKWWILVTVILGTFLGRLDQTIVNLALPKIITDFGITVTAAGWISTAYILANAVFVPVWGKLGDTTGRKRVYIIGFVVFILGSALAGLSWNLSSMIVFRVIQAIAGSADYPTAMAILAVTFTAPKERAQALGLWSASFAVASVFGPLIGGPLIDTLGWRSVFLVNIPVGLLGLAMALVFINESVSERKSVKFDWMGAVVLGLSLSSLVLVLDRGYDWGWLSLSSVLCYIATIVFSITFYVIEKNHSEPIIDLKFFNNAVFNNTLFNNFIVFMAMLGSIFLIPIFAQNFLGYNATQSGLLFLPMAVVFMIGAPLGASVGSKFPPRIVIFLSTLGAGLSIYLLSFIDARSSAWDIMYPLAFMALSMGFGMAPRTNVIASLVPASEIGVASSILALGRNIGGAFGIALFGTLLNNSIYNNVIAISHHSTINSTDPTIIGKGIALVTLLAQIDAYKTVFVVSAALLVISSFFALMIKSGKIDKEAAKEIFVEA
jgi:DHA2 family multidrug resistance protein